MQSIYLLLLISVYGNVVSGYLDMVVLDHKNVFDLNLYESVLDKELCEEQIRYIQQNETELLIEFLDAGIRTPRGILTGNVMDFGNYYQCLGIHKPITNSVVEGKYCMINVPLNQEWSNLPSTPTWPDFTLPEDWPDITWPGQNPMNFGVRKEMVKRSRDFELATAGFNAFNGGVPNDKRIADSPLAALTFQLGTCIPKTCTPRTALKALFNGSDVQNIQFEESYCRLPNDRLWVPGDYIAFSIFGFFILLVVLSTGYDIRYNLYQQKDPKKINKLCVAFSAYTNTRRLVTYTPVPGVLECLDGIRAFAMMWVIIGHTFVTQTSSQIMANPADALAPIKAALTQSEYARIEWAQTSKFHTKYTRTIRSHLAKGEEFGLVLGFSDYEEHPTSSNFLQEIEQWMTSLESIWITAAPITVDTFFMLSGLLLVYTTAGKLTSMRLVKSLHLFYLNRLLRMFPVLAAMILLQVSILSRVSDGPYWAVAAAQTHRCRVYWWSTLLHIQNFVNPSHMCLAHSWYLAIDVQLHILSPLVLVWVLTGKRRLAWSALVGALIAVLAAATTYNFIKEFPSGPVIPSRPDDSADYLTYYYVNTLTRASPFFVGLIFGYLLHLNRGKKVYLHWILASLIWICTIVIALLTVYSSYPIMQLDWKNQVADSMINSFMRPAWAMFVGWLVFACVHGYGGPVNWILCLRAWKVLSRLSYAMYIVHYPIMFVINAMPVVPIYFNVQFSLYKFLSDFMLAVIVSFIVTILIDAPCSVLIKHFMGGGPKRAPPKIVEPEHVEEKKTQL